MWKIFKHFTNVSNVSIIEFIVKHENKIEYQFRKWHYVRLKINHILIDELIKLYVDFECIMSLIDRKHLIIIKSNVIIHRVNNSIRIRDIDHRLHDNSEYIELNFYIFEKLFDNFAVITHFRREIYIVDDFRINVLLKINIVNFEKVVFDFDFRMITLRNRDDLQTSMNIVFKNHRIIRVVRSIDFIIISIHICMTVFVKIRECNLSKNRDYNFEFKQNFQILNSNSFF